MATKRLEMGPEPRRRSENQKKCVRTKSLDASCEVKTCSFGVAEFNGGNTKLPKRTRAQKEF